MSVPKKKKPSSKTKMGRSHDALKPTTLVKCPKCSKPVRPHRACSNCGTYKGRQVVKVNTKLDKAKKEGKKPSEADSSSAKKNKKETK